MTVLLKAVPTVSGWFTTAYRPVFGLGSCVDQAAAKDGPGFLKGIQANDAKVNQLFIQGSPPYEFVLTASKILARSSDHWMAGSTDTVLGIVKQGTRDPAIALAAAGFAQQAADYDSAATNLGVLIDQMTLTSYPDVATAPVQRQSSNIKKNAIIVQSAMNLLDTGLGVDMSAFVQDQIRLFYFNNVPRLLGSLSKDVRLVNPSSHQADLAEQQAKASETQNKSDKIVAQADAVDARSAMLEAAAKIADLERKKQHAKSDVTTKQQVADRASVQQSAAARRIEPLQTAVTNDQGQVTDDQKQLDQARKDRDAQYAIINDASKDKPIKDAARTALVDALSRLTTYQGRLRQDNDTLARDKAKLEDAQRASDTAVLQAAQAQRDLQDAQTAQQKIENDLQYANDDEDAAKKALTDAQRRYLLDQVKGQTLANAENDAFRAAADDAPYYFCPVLVGSSDAARKVMLYGYPDSNTIFIRGRLDDVEKVKEVIAGFDRPAPQARITLYTLQVNGSDPKNINKAISDVDAHLRDLRGTLLLVQDLLRQSVTKEVNRVAAVSHDTALICGWPTASDRMYRLFYYPEEVRHRLGLRLTLPQLMIRIESIRNDLAYGSNYLEDGSTLPGTSDAVVARKCALLNAGLDQVKSAARLAQVVLDQLNGHISRDPSVDRLEERTRVKLKGILTRITKNTQSALDLPQTGLPPGKYPSDPTGVTTLHDEIQHQNSDLDECEPDLRNNFSRPFSRRQPLDGSRSPGPKQMDPNRPLDLKQLPDTKEMADPGPSPSPPNSDSIPSAEVIGPMEYLTRWTLPDPEHATTLGEMLFVIGLGEKDSRERIIHDFVRLLQARYPAIQSSELGTAGRGKGLPKTSVQNRVRESTEINGLRRFIEEITKQVDATDAPTNDLFSPFTTDPGGVGLYPTFPGTLLGASSTDGPNELRRAELGANQQEILLALESKARESVASEIKFLCRQIASQVSTGRAASDSNFLRMQYMPLVGWLASGLIAPRLTTNQSGPNPDPNWDNSSKGTGTDKSAPVASTASASQATRTSTKQSFASGAVSDRGNVDSYLDEAESFLFPGAASVTRKTAAGVAFAKDGSLDSLRISDQKLQETDRRAWQLAELYSQRNSLARSTPRVAAADDMIKRMIIVFETDLEHFFTDPSLGAIRDAATPPGVEFGSFQRESILATNRVVARVDPEANAQSEVGAGQNFLNEAQQLGQLLQTQGAGGAYSGQRSNHLPAENKLATAAGSAALGEVTKLARAKPYNPLALGGTLGLLDLLSGLGPEPQGDVYSIHSGNVFKITPIFDPSGQALRFKFDYDASTLVQGPDGTTSLQIPTVEHHKVNTEVQLTNLEFREISRFENNARLGTPDIKSGGIPIIKDLPVIRDIPILGYFYRRHSTAATRQQSLIFAQTSIYPTVSDIVDLLIDATPRYDYGQDPPTYISGSTNGHGGR